MKYPRLQYNLSRNCEEPEPSQGDTVEMIAKSFYKGFNKRYEALKRRKGNVSLLSFTGEMGQGLSYALTAKLEQMLEAHQVPKMPAKRIFNVFMEAVQNVRKHGQVTPDGKLPAGMAVLKTPEGYQIHFSNLILANSLKRLAGHIEKINARDLKELKQYYLKVMDEGDFSDAGGAGLGIITIRLKSKTKIEFNSEHITGDYYSANIALNMQVQ